VGMWRLLRQDRLHNIVMFRTAQRTCNAYTLHSASPCTYWPYATRHQTISVERLIVLGAVRLVCPWLP